MFHLNLQQHEHGGVGRVPQRVTRQRRDRGAVLRGASAHRQVLRLPLILLRHPGNALRQ